MPVWTFWTFMTAVQDVCCGFFYGNYLQPHLKGPKRPGTLLFEGIIGMSCQNNEANLQYLMRQFVKEYVAKIEQDAKAAPREASEYMHRQKCEEERRIRELEAQARIAQSEPLEQQIVRWWSSLPDSVKRRRFLIEEISVACRGKYQVRPALRKVAQALRAIGWKHLRDQSVGGRRRNFWIPPDDETLN